jgi:hypothetical protein
MLKTAATAILTLFFSIANAQNWPGWRGPASLGISEEKGIPVTDGNYVYAFFGSEGLYCYDFQGNLIWSKDLGTFAMRNGWGMGSSPIAFSK